MTVTELIELLEECEPDATVRIMSQGSWPFENAIRGIAVRDDFAESSPCRTARCCYDDAHLSFTRMHPGQTAPQ